MKIRIKYLLYSSLFLLGCIGCDDSFFETEPTDRISVDKFWQQEKDGVLATNGCYPGLSVFKMFSFEGCSDNACTAQTWLDAYMVANGSFNSSWQWVKDTWANSYSNIRRTNDVIMHVGEIPGVDDALKNRLKGEALVIRAYLYNLLTSLYGDVPFITKPITLIEDSKVPRESKSVIIKAILEDLDEAVNYLPIRYDTNEDKGRVTRGAALALKARICLYNGMYKEARDAASQVMQSEYKYELLPNYASIFDYEHEMNAEVILDDQYMPDLRMHGSFRSLAPRSAQGLSEYVPTRSLIDEYESGDHRLNANFLLPGDPNPYIGGTFNPAPGSGTVDEAGLSYYATSTGYQYRKYVLKEDVSYTDRCNINLILIRYADVLLMFAEAENEVNSPTQAAYDAINAVRGRARGTNEAILPDLKGLSQEQFREAVRKERRIELAGEGLRYFDILRWKTAEKVLNGVVNGMDYTEVATGAKKTIIVETRKFDKNKNYLWPIPESELRLNPALAGHQNPGY